MYIPGIICAGLCYIMLLIIPSGLKSSDPITIIFNSNEKAYRDDAKVWEDYDLKTMQMVHKYQQKEHVKLVNKL